MCLSVCLSVCLCVCACVCQSVCLSVCVSVCLSVCLSVGLPACLSVCLSVCLSTLSDSLSVCLSLSLSISLSFCLSLSLYLDLCLCLFLPLSLLSLSVSGLLLRRRFPASCLSPPWLCPVCACGVCRGSKRTCLAFSAAVASSTPIIRPNQNAMLEDTKRRLEALQGATEDGNRASFIRQWQWQSQQRQGEWRCCFWGGRRRHQAEGSNTVMFE